MLVCFVKKSLQCEFRLNIYNSSGVILFLVWLIDTFFKVTQERPLIESSNTEHENDCHFFIYRWILIILTELTCLVN